MTIRCMLYDCEPFCLFCLTNRWASATRFFEKVQLAGDCWEWQGALHPAGYGKFSFMQEAVWAHRYSLSLIEPLESLLTIDHLCRNRACVNPAHLEQVTSGENSARAPKHLVHGDFRPKSPGGKKREFCMKNHPLTDDNIYLSKGSRRCKTCIKNHVATYRREKRYLPSKPKVA